MKAIEIMERLFSFSFPRDYSRTCDTCKAGDPQKEVQKVAVTMLPTPSVLQKATEWGADLLIVHEPTYYDHWDNPTEEIQQSQKRKLVEESGLTIFRFHDHPHFCTEDMIAKGMWQQIGLSGTVQYEETGCMSRLTLDTPITALELAKQIEKNCGIRHVRICGARDIPSTRISGKFGAPDGVMEELQKEDSQIVIVGETCEWMMAEYARDAGEMGRHKTLLILGHAGSEEGGMIYIANLLGELLPDLAVKYFPSGEVYTYTDSE